MGPPRVELLAVLMARNPLSPRRVSKLLLALSDCQCLYVEIACMHGECISPVLSIVSRLGGSARVLCVDLQLRVVCVLTYGSVC